MRGRMRIKIVFLEGKKGNWHILLVNVMTKDRRENVYKYRRKNVRAKVRLPQKGTLISAHFVFGIFFILLPLIKLLNKDSLFILDRVKINFQLSWGYENLPSLFPFSFSISIYLTMYLSTSLYTFLSILVPPSLPLLIYIHIYIPFYLSSPLFLSFSIYLPLYPYPSLSLSLSVSLVFISLYLHIPLFLYLSLYISTTLSTSTSS